MPDSMGPYLQSIQSDYPELSIRDSELIGRGGQYNEILIVNKDIIFRFPMFEEGLETLQQEISVLQGLQGKLSIGYLPA